MKRDTERGTAFSASEESKERPPAPSPCKLTAPNQQEPQGGPALVGWFGVSGVASPRGMAPDVLPPLGNRGRTRTLPADLWKPRSLWPRPVVLDGLRIRRQRERIGRRLENVRGDPVEPQAFRHRLTVGPSA